MSTINQFRESLTDPEINPYTALEALGSDDNCCSAVLECPFSFAGPNAKRPKAKQKYRSTLRRLYDARPSNWANGRKVQNLLEQIYKHHSVRCMRHNLFADELLTIKCCDIPDVQPKSNKNCRRIDFS